MSNSRVEVEYSGIDTLTLQHTAFIMIIDK